ncbi:MAG TPA: WhiB family transcriptional regulator [Acidimicrobiia bacterium]|nr:WhiB family transcriptional regulator [Acidimicrobiia bacterium]
MFIPQDCQEPDCQVPDCQVPDWQVPDWQYQQHWADRALCKDGTGTLVELFFSEQLDDIAAAKAFCRECPVRVPCLQGALARREPWGVWGGEQFLQGKILAQKRKRGRPPKIRPEVEIPAMLTA